MKPFGEEDLIAYHLHELSPRRARALQRELQANPQLAAESEAFAATLRAFKGDGLLAIDEEVLDRNWTELRPSLVPYRARPTVGSRWRLPALAGAGLAFASIALMIARHHHQVTINPWTSPVRQSRTIPETPPPVPGSLASDAPFTEESGRIERYKEMARLLPPPLTMNIQRSPRRRTQYLSLASVPAPVPDLISPAWAPLPVLSAPPTLPITIAPGAPVQTASNGSTHSKRRNSFGHRESQTDLTLSMGGTLVGTREANSSQTVQQFQGATRAVNAMAALHQQFHPAVGFRVTASYTRPEFQYSMHTATTTGSTVSVNSRVYELTATYVVQGPHHGRLSTSAEAGAGLMAFLPTEASTGTSYNVRGAALIGVAAEVSLTHHIAVHLAYRGQAFKGPDFHYTDYAGPVVVTTLFSNEPAVGITYRFSHK